jgi:hypothetical protein
MVRSFALAMVLIAVFAAPGDLNAQAAPTRETSSRQDLFVGFSYLFSAYAHTQLNPVSGGMAGWNAAYAMPHAFSPHFGFKVDVSGHYRSAGYFSPQIYFLMAGPQFSARAGRSTIFVHALVGGILASTDVIAQTKSDTVFATAVGGGLDHPISARLAWRVNLDWYHGGYQTNDTNQISEIVNNDARFSTGPVLRF